MRNVANQRCFSSVGIVLACVIAPVAHAREIAPLGPDDAAAMEAVNYYIANEIIARGTTRSDCETRASAVGRIVSPELAALFPQYRFYFLKGRHGLIPGTQNVCSEHPGAGFSFAVGVNDNHVTEFTAMEGFGEFLAKQGTRIDSQADAEAVGRVFAALYLPLFRGVRKLADDQWVIGVYWTEELPASYGYRLYLGLDHQVIAGELRGNYELLQ